MTIKGNLQYMSIAGLIQHNCQSYKTAKLIVTHKQHEATLFFNKGTVQHAIMGKLQGEEVVYKTLSWHEGDFTLEIGLEPPQITITRSWSGLLLEGAKRLNQAECNGTAPLNNQNNLPENNNKRKILADSLAKLLQYAAHIEGAAILDTDGLVYSGNVPQQPLDKNLIGTTSSKLLDLSKRSVKQLQRGRFKRTIIQGDEGNIIVSGIDNKTLLIGLTVPHVNLGVAFAEIRTMTASLHGIV